jgi:AcrR family transcriptional regulator
MLKERTMDHDERNEARRKRVDEEHQARWKRLTDQREQRQQRQQAQQEARQQRKEAQHKGKRPRDAERTQEALLDAAAQVFAEFGFEGARTDDIAKRAGVNVALLFRYFENKEGLYRAVIERGHRIGTGGLKRLVVPLLADDTAELDQQRVLRFLEAWIDLVTQAISEHSYLLRIFSWEMSTGWKTLRKVMPQQNEEEWERETIVFLQRAQAAGIIRAGVDLRMIFVNMFSLVMFLSFFRFQLLAEGIDKTKVPEGLDLLFDPERMRQQIKEQIFYGIFPMKPEQHDEPT